MKRYSVIILIMIIILCLSSGCGGKVADEQETPELSEMNKEAEEQARDSESTPSDDRLSDEMNGSFVFKYQDVSKTFYLKDCQCEYDRDDVKVYSKYIIGNYDNQDFFDGQYLLYIRAPFAWRQIYPVRDFKLNEETGTIYILRETEKFEALQKLELHNADGRLEPENLLDCGSAEQMIIDSHKLSENVELINRNVEPYVSDLHFEFEDGEAWKVSENTYRIHTVSTLKGYVWGSEERLGKSFYVDYEWDDQKGKETISPCILRKYDPEKDASEFKECREAFERIMQGDWSDVRFIESLEYMWGMSGEEWRQADVNKDGMPELVCQDGSGDRTEHKKPVDLIFAWNGENVDLVYMDIIDPMEFLFLTDEGQLIYEWSTSGGPKRSNFYKKYFDEKWNLETEEAVRVQYFWSKEEAEECQKYYRLKNPGKGLYFIQDYKSAYGGLASKQIGYYDFLKAYQNMTNRDFLDDNASYWEEEFRETLTGEKLFDYEIREDEKGEKYAVIKGFREEYKDSFKENLLYLMVYDWAVSFPEKLEGVEVKELAAHAFSNVLLGDYGYGKIEISPNIVTIGERCFENCGLVKASMEKAESEGKESRILTVGDGAFAGNPELWGVYISDRECNLGSGVFEGCAPKRYFCYIPGTDERNSALKAYALENNFYAAEIPAYYSEIPIVEYQETPLILTSDVRNFFYGENAWSDDEDTFCSFEYDDDAPDYGFPEWHLPCGEFCAMTEGPWAEGITASSELASADGRYAPKHLHSNYGREYAWAEGVEGNGIGESISICSRCSYQKAKDDYSEGYVGFGEGQTDPDICDGYMRYTEVCVVNGYAKNQKTWEENGRVKRLLMYVEDKPYAYLELEDTIYPQYFTLPFDAIKAADGVDIHFRFVIEDVYPGTRYEDTCLTGLVVEFMGRHGH